MGLTLNHHRISKFRAYNSSSYFQFNCTDTSYHTTTFRNNVCLRNSLMVCLYSVFLCCRHSLDKSFICPSPFSSKEIMQSVFLPIFLNRISFHQGDEKCRILEKKIYLWGVPTLNEIKKFQVPFHSINKTYVILILIHPISRNVDPSINHLSNSTSTTEMAIKLSIRSFTKNGLEILSKKIKKEFYFDLLVSS